jgi:hypothetical protein
MITEYLSDEDLRGLIRVSHNMADIACSIYLRKKKFIVSPSSPWFTVYADAFDALAVWRRSSTFSGLRIKNFNFDPSDSSQVASQMRRTQCFLRSLPPHPPPLFGHISLYNINSTTLQNCLDLLRTVSMTGCHRVTLGNVTFEDARTGSWLKAKAAVQLISVQELQLQDCQLSPSQWLNLLSDLHAPSLCGLRILGKTSMVAVYHFLRRHPDISHLELKCLSVDIPLFSRRLSLSKLCYLQGLPSNILHLLQSLPSAPSICELVIECNSLKHLPRESLIGIVMHSLTMCKGALALGINLVSKETSKAELTRVDIPAFAAYGLRSATLPCTISTFTINFEDVCDESILVRA